MSEQPTQIDKPSEPSIRSGRQNGPRIFISHDTRDAELAARFGKLISNVSAGVLKSFRSSDRLGRQGIDYGTEWFPELMSQLDRASDVVCLLTQNSVDRPWILFEAGVAKGKLNTPVHGVAIGIPLDRAITGPFAQFQNSGDDEDGLSKLVMQLLRRIPDSDPDQDVVLSQVRAFKVDVESMLSGDVGPGPGTEDRQSSEVQAAKLFEEIKMMFLELPERFEAVASKSAKALPSRRTRELNLNMVVDAAFEVSQQARSPIEFLIIASLLRDEFPWLHQLVMEIYQAASAGKTKTTLEACKAFYFAVEYALEGPFQRELGPTTQRSRILLQELPPIIHRFAERRIAMLRSARKRRPPERDGQDRS